MDCEITFMGLTVFLFRFIEIYLHTIKSTLFRDIDSLVSCDKCTLLDTTTIKIQNTLSPTYFPMPFYTQILLSAALVAHDWTFKKKKIQSRISFSKIMKLKENIVL